MSWHGMAGCMGCKRRLKKNLFLYRPGISKYKVFFISFSSKVWKNIYRFKYTEVDFFSFDYIQLTYANNNDG